MSDLNLKDKLRSYWASWANGNTLSAQRIVETCPEFLALSQTPQTKTSHAEGNVARHTILTCDAANDLAGCLPSDDRKIFRYAALLHDIGKPNCISEAAPGIYSFKDCPKISSRTARIILDKYTQISFKEKEAILALINNHQAPIWLIENGKPIRSLQRISIECNLEVLYNLSKANYIGRSCRNLREKFEQLEAFKTWCKDKNLWGGSSWDGILNLQTFKRFGKNAETAKSILDWYYLNGEIYDYLEAKEWLFSRRDWKWGMLYFTVGPPGSGKSYWIQQKYPMVPVVSTDKIREEITGNIADQSQNDEVYNIAHKRLGEFLEEGKTVIYDATNLKKDQRKNVIDIAKETGSQIIVLMFTTTYDTCLSRLKTRPVLPLSKEVLDEMFYSYDYVSKYEYNKIIYI